MHLRQQAKVKEAKGKKKKFNLEYYKYVVWRRNFNLFFFNFINFIFIFIINYIIITVYVVATIYIIISLLLLFIIIIIITIIIIYYLFSGWSGVVCGGVDDGN